MDITDVQKTITNTYVKNVTDLLRITINEYWYQYRRDYCINVKHR